MNADHEQKITYDLQVKLADDVAHAIGRVASLALDDEMKMTLTLQAAATGVSALAYMIERHAGKADNSMSQLATVLVAALMCAHALTSGGGASLHELITVAKKDILDMARAGVVVKGPLP